MVSHYRNHLFVCTNEKEAGKKCCANANASEIKNYLKDQLVSLNQHGPCKIRVSNSGCLGRCGMGPCIVMYPEGKWFTYQSQSDVDRIIQYCLGEISSPLDLEIPISDEAS